jgi:hypothetical protein
VIVACVLTFLTCLLYLKILINQYTFVRKNTLTLRLAVLNVRTVLIVPGFSICYLFSFVFPYTYIYMQLPEAFIQAYSVFCFFALFVLYAGGPSKCIEIFKATSRTFPDCMYKSSLNNNPRCFYQYAFWAHFQFIAWRPAIVAIQVVLGSFKYWFSSDMVSIFSTAMVAYAILALLKVYHVLYEHCHGLNAMTKVTAVKGTIGLVLGEGFLEEVLFAFGVIKTSEFENSLRLYCFAVVCELFVIALLLERVFNSEIKVDKAINPEFQPHIVINETTDGVHQISFCDFVRCVFDVMDVFTPVLLPLPPALPPTDMMSESSSSSYMDRDITKSVSSTSGVTELTTRKNPILNGTRASHASHGSLASNVEGGGEFL